jgi:hypothetical protein
VALGNRLSKVAVVALIQLADLLVVVVESVPHLQRVAVAVEPPQLFFTETQF